MNEAGDRGHRDDRGFESGLTRLVRKMRYFLQENWKFNRILTLTQKQWFLLAAVQAKRNVKAVGSPCRRPCRSSPGRTWQMPPPLLSFCPTAQADSAHLLCPDLLSVAAHFLKLWAHRLPNVPDSQHPEYLRNFFNGNPRAEETPKSSIHQVGRSQPLSTYLL